MATARKLPSGSWRIQVFDHKDVDGKKHYKSFTAPTEYYVAAEPPVRCGVSHLSGLTEPLI